jgi:triacylglycerol esterase/lipase EstA (alpha/beta hydrolase family)
MSLLFWKETCRYGAIHRGSTKKYANKRCLVIFVHGLFGDSLKTWGKMPEWVLTKAGVDCDVISFDYPSKPWERSSLEQAADDLAVWLDNEFNNHGT